MKYLPLLWSNLWRKKIRTIFTLLSIFVAFLLFGLLMTIRTAFSFGVDIAGLDRLVLIHKVSLIMPLPVSYLERLRATEGVTLATHNSWFGGVYQDPSNFFAQIAVEPEPFMKIYPEFKLPPEQMKAWLADRQGAVVGVDLAKRFNWKIGDRIPIQGTIWQPKQGQTWEFNIVGIYDGEPGVDKTQFFFRYDYLDENRRGGDGLVGWYIVKIADPSQAQADGREVRRDVRQLVGRDQDHDREGLRRRLRQAGRRHRRDHDRDPRRGALHDAAGGGQHDGAVGARAHQRARRAEDARLLQRVDPGAGARRIGVDRGARRRRSACGLAWLFVQQGDPTGGMLPIFILPARDVAVGGGLIVAARPGGRRAAGGSRRCT